MLRIAQAMSANMRGSKTFNNHSGFEHGFWQRKTGSFLGTPKRRIFGKQLSGRNPGHCRHCHNLKRFMAWKFLTYLLIRSALGLVPIPARLALLSKPNEWLWGRTSSSDGLGMTHSNEIGMKAITARSHSLGYGARSKDWERYRF
jgi:hypothetical protein